MCDVLLGTAEALGGSCLDRPESTGIDPQAMPRLLMRRPRPPREVVLCAHFLFKRLAGAKNGCFCEILRPSPPSRVGCTVTRWGSYLIRIDWVRLDQKAMPRLFLTIPHVSTLHFHEYAVFTTLQIYIIWSGALPWRPLEIMRPRNQANGLIRKPESPEI